MSAVSFFREKELLRSYAKFLQNLTLDFNLNKSIHLPVFSRPHLSKTRSILLGLGRQLFYASITRTTYTGLRVLSFLVKSNKVCTKLVIVCQTILNSAMK